MKKAFLFLLVLMLVFGSLFAKGSSEASSTVVASDVKKGGGDIVIATTLTTNTMSPFEIRGSSVYAELLYESLMKFDEAGTPQPYLVESVEEDNEALTYTFKLKKGIKFHDGTELTADVAKWNLDTYKERGALSSSFMSKVSSIEVVDNYTFVVHLSSWDAFFLYSLARPCGCGYMVSKDAFEKNGNDTISTGPFMLESWEQGVYTKVVKFSDYWQGAPYLDSVTLKVFASNVVAQASLTTGEIDAIFNIDYDTASYLADMGYIVNVTTIPSNNHTICFHCVDPDSPLYDIRVRQAIAYAIDRNAIASALFSGYGEASSQYGAPGSTYYNEKVTGYEYDPEKAKSLLADAGYANGFSTVLTTFPVPLWTDICQIVVEELAAVGIKVEMNITDGAGYAVAVDGWSKGLFFHPMGLDNGPAAQISANYVQGLTSGLGVASFLHPDEINDAIVLANNSTSEESIKLFKEVQKMIFEDYCLLKSIGVTYSTTVVNPKLKDSGLGAVASSMNTLWKAYFE